MVKLTKSELARRWVQTVNVELEDGDRLGDLVEKHGPDCCVYRESGWYDDPDTYWLRYSRQETDEEYEARIEARKAELAVFAARQRDAKKKRDEDERKTYERLKKKFEKN